MKIYISLCFIITHLIVSYSFGQGTPVLMINEQDHRYDYNPTIILYSDGTIIKNANEAHEIPEYFIIKLDSGEYIQFLKQLNLKQLLSYEREYNCSPAVSDRNNNSIYYFGEQDTIQIEVYGNIRKDAFLLHHRDDFPDVELINCLPQDFSKLLGHLLYFDHGSTHWIPTFYFTIHYGEVKKLRGTKLGAYKRRVSYYFPGEELWINRSVKAGVRR